jgi:uncharacterized membrane protein YccC
MKRDFQLHLSSLRFALALWMGSVLALYAAFFFQLEPAQWAGVTVWVMFIQTPRLNYSKLIYWSLGTIVGAIFAIALIDCFNQDRVLFIGGLTAWLSGCAFVANRVKAYNAYGAVLAGYTAAIVALSSVDQPDQVFNLAVSRVSCIFVGMAAAILAMTVFLPRHPHWKETLHHLGELTREVCACAVAALQPGAKENSHEFPWAKVSDRLSLLEHTLEPTTAESADSRLRAAPARSVAASLFCLLAKSQSIEACLVRNEVEVPPAVRQLLSEARTVLGAFPVGETNQDSVATAEALRHLRTRVQAMISGVDANHPVIPFLLLRLDEVAMETENVLTAWAALDSPGMTARPSRLDEHQDHPVALSAALRMALAMSIAGIFWIATGWPAGAQFVLFTAIVCSLLTLQDDPRNLGWGFLKGACVCAAVAFVDLFWFLQLGEGFLLLACALGLFLVPAAYVYRKPAMIGGAVPCMLLFYNLVVSSNQMTYDISTFLNNAFGYILATGFAFFAFHAILPPKAPARCAHLLKTIWRDLEEMRETSDPLREQGWISLLCDRIRLLHRFGDKKDLTAHDAEARLGLQLGLRRMRLQSLFASSDIPEIRAALSPILNITRKISTASESVVLAISQGRHRLQNPSSPQSDPLRRETLAELSEMESILRSRLAEVHQHV